MKVLVTGSSGLIGSEAVTYYDREGHHVIGVDNNMRANFFGAPGDTTWNLNRLKETTKHFEHHNIDIRDRQSLFELFEQNAFDLVIHCAAQPSHDKACQIPLLDFEVNALGTVNLLEATRQFCPDAVFIHMSTNKVYGDAPNEVPLIEMEKRYDYARQEDFNGISEECRIDRCLHSLFGASKTSADVVAQEYGRYFGMKVGIFRGGCLTGPSHSGVELHGFLSYLVKVAVSGGTYKVFGYKGKQVRDNIHSYDVIQAFEAFRHNPRAGEVYNLGGGRSNSVSILEAFDLIESLTSRKVNWVYLDENRIGDHICYISDLSKMNSHFPEWGITLSLEEILQEIVVAQGQHYAGV
ncbi:NAD-dependent epimerase/dehydratase family protein [Aetokthonos hydrillicola Thurmond2011]|jgi:CDP-paratose 2-epimerase|uniref:NAD-dependent epimerase/dehydratase family protein n=1 Tax=Aetokthonos hydrillicola Thurmond2011 TaxID=2712845 RepID=A0AAP5I7L1_9CYAN|nr:NAD-dependent epimerase/dehydratase family protein [Aetokthonos hydrillicola]MBO3457600.1 NAD-dependent epimerase/dehydratase family protein [Aetokthonos hydrillicola CCALA 1050]MBW4587878.1 NAD-dependent epimerase/dehydratase family protein [Aetokthonos hydrillicola CCALA 1050]MDR9894718.1 NAD-dependent epimerase/dehydratase family protein [Aetokthonos hydrillicola Thurmond2011]